MTLILPYIATLFSLIIKYILDIFNYQKFNFRGHPSGHAATLSALITYLYLSNANKYLLLTTFVLSSLYLFDLCLIYYYDIKDKNNQKLGHSISEIFSGLILGVLTVLIYNKFYKI